ncbi:MAG: amino acid ABC transporter ATP-binding protein [archaeon]
MANYLQIKNIKKKFGSQTVLDNINFSVNKKEVVAIMGPSGGGKTTLLKIIAGLEKADRGQIIFSKLNPHIGFVFQEFNLWPHKTVLENVIEAPMLVKKIEKERAIVSAKKILKEVGLSHKLNKYPLQLSGGEKQRTAIARTLIMNPEIILMDEITSNLDPERIRSIDAIIKKLIKEGFTLVIVSHDLNFIENISNKIILLDKGKIIESGNPIKILKNPTKKRTKEFISTVLKKQQCAGI